MNILLVTEYFPNQKQPKFQGGVQARTYHIAKRLAEKNYVEILSLNRGNIEASFSSLIRRLIFFLMIIFYRPKEHIDVVEASNATTFIPAFILAKRLRTVTVAWVPDVLGKTWFNYFPFPVACFGFLAEKISLRLKWSGIIAMSRATRTKLESSRVATDRISVIYGGVDCSAIAKIKVKKYPVPTICTISRLLAYKRLSDLIIAVDIIRKRITEIQCLVIGEGPEEGRLKQQIRSLHLEKQVKIIKNLPHLEVMQILKRCQVFCLPSLVEGFGIVTVEAMAAGLPFVNAKIRPSSEITRGGKGGLLFEPKDPRDLAKNMVKILSSKDLYREKQRQGQALALTYDWDIIAKQTETFYKNLIE